jgi:hypothetical protein
VAATTADLDRNKEAFVCTVTCRDLLTQNFQIVVRVPPVVRQPPVVLTYIFPVAALAVTVGFRWPFYWPLNRTKKAVKFKYTFKLFQYFLI